MDQAGLLHNAIAAVSQAYGAQIDRLLGERETERAFARNEIERLKSELKTEKSYIEMYKRDLKSAEDEREGLRERLEELTIRLKQHEGK